MINANHPRVVELMTIANATVLKVDGGEYIDYQVRDFEEEAVKAGFIKLGSGFFSQAWYHPEISRYAIKLGFKKEDSGAAYAAYCRSNQGKAGIPVIHDITRTKACYVVIMDKLFPYNKVDDIYRPKHEYYLASGRGELPKPRCMKEYSVAFNIIRSVPRYGLISSEYLELPIYRTCKDIQAYFVGIASFDMHDGNIMVDRFGNLVITDPVSFTKTEQVTKVSRVDRLRSQFGHMFEPLTNHIHALAFNMNRYHAVHNLRIDECKETCFLTRKR